MATHNELIQALNTAFTGVQRDTLQNLLTYIDATAVAAAGTIANLPVATSTTLGIAKFGSGTTVTAGAVTVP